MPDDLRKIADAAFENHYMNENHHPEIFLYEKDRKGRWALPNILECACDLQAMAQEFGEGSFEIYFRDVWLEKQTPRFVNDAYVKEVMLAALACFKHKEGITSDLPQAIP